MSGKIWRPGIVLLLMMGSITLGGCTAAMVGAPKPLTTSADLEKEVTDYLKPNVVNNYQNKWENPSAQANYRDQVIYARIAVIDARFREFLTNLGVQTKTLGIGADSAVIALNTGAVLSGAETGKNILSGLAGAITGIKGSVDKNAFYDQTMPSLVNQMLASRREVLADILGYMKTRNDGYSMVQALVDLERYEFAGSFSGALQQINQTAGNKIQVAEARIQQLPSTNLTVSDVGPNEIAARDALMQRIIGLSGPQAIAAVKKATEQAAFQADLQSAQQAGADATTGAGAKALLRLLLTNAFDSNEKLAALEGIIKSVSTP